jgi:nucleotide-binding universal stress UspA family protein
MKIGEILLPTDFSAAAEAAAWVAVTMAQETGARLHVAHVVPVATDPSPGSEQLTRLGRRLGKEVTVEIALLSGRAAREITGYARDKGIDLIVMSTHGRTGMSRALLGSVAEAVVRLAPCLVLTVPTTPAARASGSAQVGAQTPPHHCIVCAGATDDLVCERCRTRIRGKGLESTTDAEDAGRHGTPA